MSGKRSGDSSATEPGRRSALGARIARLPSRLCIGLIRFYQRSISPLHPGTCRFRPTCSQYALEAIQKYGALKGGLLALRRILRCHPFSKGGYDPVP